MEESSKQATTVAQPDSGRKRSKLPMIVLPLIFITAIAAVFYFYSKIQNPLRGVVATSLEKVTISSSAAELEMGGYEIDPQLWTKSIVNFQSTMVNWAPAKWQSIAKFQFHPKDGDVIYVDVFKTDSEVGCFRINGVYYTGGDEPLVSRMLSDCQKGARVAPRE